MHPPAPAIGLVPGFFGFDHRGESTYFADRFVAGIRSVLEARGHRGVPVLSLSTLGIASLAERQTELLAELRGLESPSAGAPKLGGPRTWHLVGHSTGGVDAALLLRDAPLARGEHGSTFASTGWGEWKELVERVSSVTTIAAPHFGTGLAESPLARFAAGRPSLRALRDAAAGVLALTRRGDLGSRARFAMSATPGLAKMPFFLVEMMIMNELARDLRPDVVGQLSARPVRAAAEGRMAAVVTVSPRPAADHPDRLFRDMWRWTHGGAAHADTQAQPVGSSALDDPEHRLPTQRAIVLPPLAPGDNDGIATSQRQLLGELLGVVIADHVDVLGRYQRYSLVDGKVIDPGLLTSGANFGDDEFFGLLLRLGERLAAMVSSASPR